MAEPGRSDSTAPFGIPLIRIVEARNDFAAAWSRPGARPQIESYLARVADHERARLLQELLSLELELRRAARETPTAEEYWRRFPSDGAVLSLFFGPTSDWTHCGGPIDGDGSITSIVQFEPIDEGLGAIGIFGDFHLLGLLGRGGMGEVYRALQKSAGRVVALKVIRPDYSPGSASTAHDQLVKRFQTEAQAAAQLEHENIVPVYEVGEIQGRSYYAMRFIEGANLADAVQSHPLSARKAAELLEPISRAVAYAHEKGILHRDIKPRNILVDRLNKPYVADFGLAKGIRDASELTKSGEVLGTPSYIAPEQARDSAHVGPAVDIYSLGATLYHLITGRPPFQAAEPIETLRQVLGEEPLPPRRLVPTLDRDIETICLKCLEKEPSRRYESANALADDLRRYLNSEPIVARPTGRIGRTWRWCRRNRLVASLLAGLFCSLLTTAAASMILLIQTKSDLLKSTQAEENERKLREIAMLEKSKADAGFDKAYRTANRFLFDFDYSIFNSSTLREMPEVRELRRRLLTDAVRNYREILDDRPNDEQFMADLAETYIRLADVNEQLGNRKEFERELGEAIALRERLYKRDPKNWRWRREFALALANLSDLEALKPNWNAAIAAASRARDLFVEQLADPTARTAAVEARLNASQLEADLLEATETLSKLAEQSDKIELQRQTLEGVLTLARKAMVDFPHQALGFAKSEANALRKLGEFHQRHGDAKLAAEHLERSAQRWSAIVDTVTKRALANPNDKNFIVHQVATCHLAWSNVLESASKFQAAEAASRQTIERLVPIVKADPRNLPARRYLFDAYDAMGRQLCFQNKLDSAIDFAGKVRALAAERPSGNEHYRAALQYGRIVTKIAENRPSASEDQARKANCERSALELLHAAKTRGLLMTKAALDAQEFRGLAKSADFLKLLAATPAAAKSQ